MKINTRTVKALTGKSTTRMGHSAGFSLLETTVGLVFAALAAVVAATYVTDATQANGRNADQVFAYAKAQAMLEELRAVAESGETKDASELDRFDDGSRTVFTLTLQTKLASTDLVDPDSPASGNRKQGTDWRYSRRITVRPFNGIDTRDLRVLTVRIFKHDADDLPGAELANLSTVVRTLSDTFPPSQVFDVYLVALENVPGWWVNLGSLKPFVEASLRDMMARNPGLELRTHWITKAGYGRNPQYTPYFNETNESTDTIPFTYFYPGTMPAGSSTQFYYVPERVKGRANVDGVVRNNYDATDNPFPYTLADQFNHVMRLPDAEALFDARVAAGQEDPDVPTWRLFLERLNFEPDRYKNAIIVNLHGELLPMPALRNFSDAAREPLGHPGVRVVTHPEKLRATRDDANPSASDDVRLRVYTYKTQPGVGPELLTVPVIIEIPGIDLTADVNGLATGTPSLVIGRVQGGLDLDPVDTVRDDYQLPDLAPVEVGTGPHATAYSGEMYSRVYFAPASGGRPGTTVIELHGSPLIAPSVSLAGLASASRLYGMEYIPCSTEASNDFSVNLSTAGSTPKNTARWIIAIPAAMLGTDDRRLQITTRIGAGDGGDLQEDGAAFSTGIMNPPAARNQPENISNTYAWWAASPDVVPFTERFQFQGDPRHSPYADTKSGGSSFPNGYNWYHDDFQTSSVNAISDWPGFDAGRIKNNSNATDDGWERRVEIDVPRFFQLLRGGLVTSETLYTSMTGWSYYYMGIGNEIGYDSANGFPNSIPVSGEPFGAPGTTGFEQAITSSSSTWGSGVKYVRSAASGNYWWGIPWLGELYPDSAYDASWRVPEFEYTDALPLPSPAVARGNLPAGSGAAEFYRTRRQNISVNLPRGTALRPGERRTRQEGCTSFFNTGTSSATFHHQGQSNTTGDLTTLGAELAADFRIPLPTTTPVSRPFVLAGSGSGGVGDEFNFNSEYPKYALTQRDMYYDHSSGATGSALIQVTNPDASRTGYQLVHGIDRTLESGSAFIARYSIATLVHGYFRAGDPGLTTPLALSPRVDIRAPTAISDLSDPTSITITWRTAWQRWDGIDYSRTQSSAITESESALEYRLIYSEDGGDNWKHMQDDSAAIPGRRPADTSLLLTDQNDGANETYAWSTPSPSIPEGSYIIRLEAWRVGSSLHMSYHQERIFIGR